MDDAEAPRVILLRVLERPHRAHLPLAAHPLAGVRDEPAEARDESSRRVLMHPASHTFWEALEEEAVRAGTKQQQRISYRATGQESLAATEQQRSSNWVGLHS